MVGCVDGHVLREASTWKRSNIVLPSGDSVVEAKTVAGNPHPSLFVGNDAGRGCGRVQDDLWQCTNGEIYELCEKGAESYSVNPDGLVANWIEDERGGIQAVGLELEDGHVGSGRSWLLVDDSGRFVCSTRESEQKGNGLRNHEDYQENSEKAFRLQVDTICYPLR